MEFLGTFFLSTSIALSSGQDVFLTPDCIGFTLIAVIYTYGHISGAHFNPAVTVAILMSGRGKIDIASAMGYIISQVAGAFCAASICWIIADDAGFETGYPSVADGVSPETAILVEIINTFLLVSVILNVATTKSQDQNGFYGVAIGLTVTAGAISAGPISGGAFNPAVGTALPGIHGITTNLFVYWCGPIVGAILATGAFFLYTDPMEFR